MNSVRIKDLRTADQYRREYWFPVDAPGETRVTKLQLSSLTDDFVTNDRVAKTIEEFDPESSVQIPSSKLLAKFAGQNKSNINIYISPDGKDTYDGTKNSPLFSLTKACEKLAQYRSNMVGISYIINCLPTTGDGVYKYNNAQNIYHPDCIAQSGCRIIINGNNNQFNFKLFADKLSSGQYGCINIRCATTMQNASIISGIPDENFDNSTLYQHYKEGNNISIYAVTCQFEYIYLRQISACNFSIFCSAGNKSRAIIEKRCTLNNIHRGFNANDGIIQFNVLTPTSDLPDGSVFELKNIDHIIHLGANAVFYLSNFNSKRNKMKLDINMRRFFIYLSYNAQFLIGSNNPDGVSFDKMIDCITANITTENDAYVGMKDDIIAKDIATTSSPLIMYLDNDGQRQIVSNKIKASKSTDYKLSLTPVPSQGGHIEYDEIQENLMSSGHENDQPEFCDYLF